MDVAELFLELYGRVPPLAAEAVDGATVEMLTTAPTPDANTIAWLVWHAGRVHDHHLSEILEVDQIWVSGDWAPRFGLDPDPNNTGYGHRPADVAAVRPADAGVLSGYLEAVDRRTRPFLAGLTPGDLDRVVDRRWDPPVTLGVRLVSVADDTLQHVGQAAYFRGLLNR